MKCFICEEELQIGSHDDPVVVAFVRNFGQRLCHGWCIDDLKQGRTIYMNYPPPTESIRDKHLRKISDERDTEVA
jgi:hypothetical protein